MPNPLPDHQWDIGDRRALQTAVVSVPFLPPISKSDQRKLCGPVAVVGVRKHVKENVTKTLISAMAPLRLVRISRNISSLTSESPAEDVPRPQELAKAIMVHFYAAIIKSFSTTWCAAVNLPGNVQVAEASRKDGG